VLGDELIIPDTGYGPIPGGSMAGDQSKIKREAP